MERGGSIRKGWIAGGIGMEEARQGWKKRGKGRGRKGGEAGGREEGLTAGPGNHTVEFQPGFKTMQVWSNIRRPFR